MTYFRELEPEGQVAIIVQNGVFKQAPLYTRAGYLFAKVGSGFVRLADNGSTSHSGIRVETLICDAELHRDSFGRLCDASVRGAKALDDKTTQLLLGASE